MKIHYNVLLSKAAKKTTVVFIIKSHNDTERGVRTHNTQKCKLFWHKTLTLTILKLFLISGCLKEEQYSLIGQWTE